MNDAAPTAPQVETPVQLLFALGQLTGTVQGLSRGVDSLNGTIASIAKRVDQLEADNDRRKGQNSVLTISISAVVSIVVSIVAGVILIIIRGA